MFYICIPDLILYRPSLKQQYGVLSTQCLSVCLSVCTVGMYARPFSGPPLWLARASAVHVVDIIFSLDVTLWHGSLSTKGQIHFYWASNLRVTLSVHLSSSMYQPLSIYCPKSRVKVMTSGLGHSGNWQHFSGACPLTCRSNGFANHWCQYKLHYFCHQKPTYKHAKYKYQGKCGPSGETASVIKLHWL